MPPINSSIVCSLLSSPPTALSAGLQQNARRIARIATVTSIKFAVITDTVERRTIESVTNVGIRIAERRSLEMII